MRTPTPPAALGASHAHARRTHGRPTAGEHLGLSDTRITAGAHPRLIDTRAVRAELIRLRGPHATALRAPRHAPGPEHR